MHELEKLILSVMKKELSTVVNLGAVLGFLIGIIGALIQRSRTWERFFRFEKQCKMISKINRKRISLFG